MSFSQSEQSSKDLFEEVVPKRKIKSLTQFNSRNSSRNNFDIQQNSDFNIFGNLNIKHSIDLNSAALCCKFSHDGKKIAVGLSDGSVKICKSSTGEEIYYLPAPSYQISHAGDTDSFTSVAVTSLNFVPPQLSTKGEVLVVTYCSGLINIWHVATKKVLSTIKENRQTLTSELSTNFQFLITAGKSDQLHQYDLETNKLVQTFEPRLNKDVMDGHRLNVLSVKWHPNYHGNFISGGWDDTVHMWDVREPHSVRHIYGPHICGGDGIDIDSKHDHILTASWRHHDTLQVWDYKSGSLIESIRTDYHGSSYLYCSKFLGNHHIMSAGSDQNMLKITNKQTLESTGVISNLKTGVYSLDYDHANIGPQDVTTISCATGPQLHILSNQPIQL